MAISMPSLGRLPQLGRAGAPRSAAERIWLAAGAFVALLLVLIGYFAFIHGQQAKTTAIQSSISDSRRENVALQSRIDLLRSQNKNLATYQAAVAKARLALPTTAGVADFLRTLQTLGGSTATSVTAVTVGAPAPVTPTTPATATSTATAAAPAPAAAAAAAPTLYSMSMTAQVSGSASGVTAFLKQLQSVQPRAVLLTNVTQSLGTDAQGQVAKGAGTTLSLTMVAFIAPNHLAPAAGATPSATATP